MKLLSDGPSTITTTIERSVHVQKRSFCELTKVTAAALVSKLTIEKAIEAKHFSFFVQTFSLTFIIQTLLCIDYICGLDMSHFKKPEKLNYYVLYIEGVTKDLYKIGCQRIKYP